MPRWIHRPREPGRRCLLTALLWLLAVGAVRAEAPDSGTPSSQSSPPVPAVELIPAADESAGRKAPILQMRGEHGSEELPVPYLAPRQLLEGSEAAPQMSAVGEPWYTVGYDK